MTGANGMAGRALVKKLRALGYNNLLTPGSSELDNRDQALVHDFLKRERPDYVFHLAGHIGGIGASIERPVEFMYENLIIALNVIHAADEADVTKLMFIGSSCIYPQHCPQPMNEKHLLTGTLEPTNEGYAIAKIAGIKLCEYYRRQFGRDFISILPCNLYGYNDHFEPVNSHVMSALMFKMHQAKLHNHPSVEIWGTGKSRREFLFVDDFADAMVYFMERPSDPDISFINIGPGSDLTVAEVAEMIRDTVGYQGRLEFNPEKPDGMPMKLLDVDLANRLGWRTPTSFKDGLRATYEWYAATEEARK